MAPLPRRPRTRGAIDQLPSGAYRVRVYAGTDPLTGKRHDLIDVVPPGPRAATEAEKVRTQLLSQLDERRNRRTKATVNQLLDRYLEVVDLDESTRRTYRSRRRQPARAVRRATSSGSGGSAPPLPQVWGSG